MFVETESNLPSVRVIVDAGLGTVGGDGLIGRPWPHVRGVDIDANQTHGHT